MSDPKKLARVLLSSGALDEAGVAKAEAVAGSRSIPLHQAIVSLDLADESVVWRGLAKVAGMKFVDPAKWTPKAEMIARLPADQIEQNQAIPVLEKDGVLWVAIDDPVRTFVADNLAFLAGCEVQCALMPPKALKEAIRKVASGNTSAVGSGGGKKGKGGLADEDDDAPIVRLVTRTISEALDARASDIHVEPFESRIRVRYRVDGILREHSSLDPDLLGPLTSRLKIMASMDIAEKRKPQDGRIDFRVGGREIDIRTSVLPGNHGETVVMRLLDKEKSLHDLQTLGFEGEDLHRFERIIKRPNGIFLVTGPTGSGKTTTLYAALSQLNRSDVKIITAEDPVEFNIGGINQCQVRGRIGLDFARILRAMLRQAPNIILVGEIRDRETAEIAVQAALTGHLVFSTLHTNDAPSAVTRLVDMGVQPFLVSAGLQAVLAQRLVRVLCNDCKVPHELDEVQRRTLGLTADYPAEVFQPSPDGCDSCEGNGYRGRLGIFELMQMDQELREMTFRGTSTTALRQYAVESAGMSTLMQDGVRKVLEGRTSLEELLRVTAKA